MRLSWWFAFSPTTSTGSGEHDGVNRVTFKKNKTWLLLFDVIGHGL
jgi:hypothetical protein